MKMHWYDQVLYNPLKLYVKDSLPAVAKSQSVRDAFQKYGQIDRATLERALKWDELPWLNIVDLGFFRNGMFDDDVPDEINIDLKLVKSFLLGRDLVKAKFGKVHLVGVTILHELIHWADARDGLDWTNHGFPEEEGDRFEEDVYGKVLG